MQKRFGSKIELLKDLFVCSMLHSKAPNIMHPSQIDPLLCAHRGSSRFLDLPSQSHRTKADPSAGTMISLALLVGAEAKRGHETHAARRAT
jgi:hypothetical protein